MGQGRSRLQRKARGVVRSDHEREASEALGAVRRERDAVLAKVSAEYRKDLAALNQKRWEARHEAEEKYEGARDAILRTLAATEDKGDA